MKRINLLPPEARTRASRERGLLYAIIVLVVIVVGLGALYLQQNSKVSGLQADIDAVTAQTSAQEAKKAELQPYAAIDVKRLAMSQTAEGLYEAGVPWSTILQEISLVIPENIRLTTFSGTVPASMMPGTDAATAATAAATASADISFGGITSTHKDVAEFMTRLGLIPQLKDIKLVSSVKTAAAAAGPSPTATVPPVTFQITAALRPYSTLPPPTVLVPMGTVP